jgi:WD40 repeat protein
MYLRTALFTQAEFSGVCHSFVAIEISSPSARGQQSESDWATDREVSGFPSVSLGRTSAKNAQVHLLSRCLIFWREGSSTSVKVVRCLEDENVTEFHNLLEHKITFRLNSPFASIALSPNGNFLVTGGRDDQTVNIWDLQTGLMLRSWLVTSVSPYPGANIVDAIALSPDGKILVTGGSVLKAWEFETGRQIRVFKGSTSYTGYMTISADGSILVTENAGHADGTINLWDLNRGKKIRRQIGSAFVKWVISPDSRTVVGSDRFNESTLKVWSAITGEKLRTLDNCYAIKAKQLTFSPDGRLLARGGIDGIKVWDYETGEQIQRVEKYRNTLFHKHLDCIRSLVFSPDNRSILSSGEDGLIQVWDVGTGENTGSIEGQVFWIALSSDSKTLIGVDRSQTVKVWRTPG